MHINTKISEGLAIMGSVDPASLATGVATTAWVPVKDFFSFLALIATGVLGAGATIDAKIQQAKDSSGTGAKDLAGKAITQVVKASGDGKQALIDFRAQDLDTNGGYAFVRLSVTVGGSASQAAAFLFGGNARYEPVVDLGAASVVQVV